MPGEEMLGLEDYDLLVEGKPCVSCQSPLPGLVEHYDHSGGWRVRGFAERQWLFVVCQTSKCQYENALWKLGIMGRAIEEGYAGS